MKVLVACEFSGVVREAFRAKGHDAWSCDLLPSDDNSSFHIKGDVLEILEDGWDLMIAHPPCTHLAVSGSRWFKEKIADGRQQAALDFVKRLMDAPIPKICVENPVSVISSKIRKPDQIIQPYHFGHGAMKTTCLWLKNLPNLKPTEIVDREYIISKKGVRYTKWSYDTFNLPKEIRAKERSRTFQGIATAMANQWGSVTAPLAAQKTLL